MVWKRFKTLEKEPIMGWWEDETTASIITLTNGLAHVVHRGVAAVFRTPEELYSSKPETIAKTIAKKLNPSSVTED